ALDRTLDRRAARRHGGSGARPGGSWGTHADRSPPGAAAGGGGVKILVVDDDLELSSLIGYALRQAGYMVVEAADGIAALEAFERESPALVILDVNLPRL